MKTPKTLLILIMLAFAGVGTVLAGNETQNRKVRNFNAIKVSTGIDLYISMGNEESVKIVADDDIIDDIKTEVENGTLRIYMKQNNSWFNWGGNTSRKAYVTVKELVKLDASSGSDVETEDTLEGDELNVKVSSGADVKLSLHIKKFSIDTSSGSDARLSGKVKYLDVEASSGSDINARDLESAFCSAKASSGSDISLTVTEEIHARASSGADIVYYGSPGTKDIDESSGGDVHQR
ncbi:MAG: head GIN domain-containing protein [Draconibacterium sp.]